MAGMIDVGNNMKTNALSGMVRLSELEQAREQTEKALDAQDAAAHKSNMMAGAGLGAAAGYLGAEAMSVTGPVGMAIGFVGGTILGSLF